MKQTTIHRIKEYLDYKGVNVSSFERIVSMSNGSFASQLKNNKSIGVDKLENILNIYQDINTEWLLTGNGNMIKKIISPITESLNDCINYKDLSNARLEIIELQKSKIVVLENEIIKLREEL